MSIGDLISCTFLNDLKEARERLNQNAKNSSIPPSSEAPWDNLIRKLFQPSPSIKSMDSVY